MRGNRKSNLYLLLLSVFAAGCAATSPKFKNESDELFHRYRGSEAAALYPVAFEDIYLTIHHGDEQLAENNIESADLYYQLAIGKISLLEKQYVDDVKRREEAARLVLEQQEKEAAEELRRKLELERERAEEAANAAFIAKKIAAEKAEARRRAERARYEKEAIPAATHTVKRGETLPQIAALAEVYGDSALWPLLYRANRDQISNPAVLWPGQVLRIPRNYDRNDLNEARRFSSDRQLR
ncbi:MAG: peptidoglycan-binding protein LysM [Deltaproteobacteria bacterium]|nr:peptidoglycan-binding protein LysM [Deltaproteobacteria bacterium]